MLKEDIALYRSRADECHQQAEKAINPVDKSAWLRLAGDWTKLAQAAEARRR
jgi:hypothetical protein